MQEPLQLDGEAYVALLMIAKNALKTANALRVDMQYESLEALLPNQLDVIALDYAISALEAYINYLGFIFINAWRTVQRKNFWIQYEQLAHGFKKIGIDLGDEPLRRYRELRDKRNHLHHLQVLESHEEGAQDISMEDAKYIVEAVDRFMKAAQKKIKEVAHQYGSLGAMVRAIEDELYLEEREVALKSFLKQSFKF